MSQLDYFLSTGLESIETTTVAAVPVVGDICDAEKELVLAATDASKGEGDVLIAINEIDVAEKAANVQERVVVEVGELHASMEAFASEPVTKAEVALLGKSISEATFGEMSAEKIHGSLEAFGVDVTAEAQLNAGLESLGTFLTEAKAKLRDARRVLVAKVTGFFKDAFLTLEKIDRRADAVIKLANGTDGETTSSSIQLPLDTAWRISREGKVPTNLSKELGDLAKVVKAVMKDSPDAVNADRKRLVDLVTPLTNANAAKALEIARKLADYKFPKLSFASVKVPTASTSVDLARSVEMMGGKAIFVKSPVQSKSSESLRKGLGLLIDSVMETDICVGEMSKRQARIDCAFETLSPAEIIKVAEDVKAVLADMSTYKKTYAGWDEEHKDLDRLMEVVATVSWEGDEFDAIQEPVNGVVIRESINVTIADAIFMSNQMYNYLSVGPVYVVMGELIPVLNRIMEVTERCLATYKTNSIK